LPRISYPSSYRLFGCVCAKGHSEITKHRPTLHDPTVRLQSLQEWWFAVRARRCVGTRARCPALATFRYFGRRAGMPPACRGSRREEPRLLHLGQRPACEGDVVPAYIFHKKARVGIEGSALEPQVVRAPLAVIQRQRVRNRLGLPRRVVSVEKVVHRSPKSFRVRMRQRSRVEYEVQPASQALRLSECHFRGGTD